MGKKREFVLFPIERLVEVMETIVHLIGPLHPPLVHFAIVCPILAAAALMVFAKTRTPWLPEAAAWLWILTFLSGLAGWLSGHLFSLELGLEGSFSLIPSRDILKGLLQDHVLWAMGGILASTLTLAAAVATLRKKPWPLALQILLGLACAVLFGLTGQHGGEMVYGERFPSPTSSRTPLNFMEITADYRKKLVKLNAKPWNSRTHGHRWVNTFVSKEAVEAYKSSLSLPEGAVVVKESFEDAEGKPSKTPGPLYVMIKSGSSNAPKTGGWLYALSWEKPVKGNLEGIQMPVTWLPGDPNLGSCIKCHDRFKDVDRMGGIPEGYEN